MGLDIDFVSEYVCVCFILLTTLYFVSPHSHPPLFGFVPSILFYIFLHPSPPFRLYGLTHIHLIWYAPFLLVLNPLTGMYLARAQEINVNIVCVSYRVRQFFRGKIDEIINTKSINSLRYILNKVIYFSILNKLSMFLLSQGGETLKYDVLSI